LHVSSDGEEREQGSEEQPISGTRMLGQQSGTIINITSIAGHVGLAKTTAYCAAKSGVELMTRSLALDWAQKVFA
jgi:NAD(P)-dependent dehydrogenase (short-subunit alcohol dehydrogenase family)